MPTSLLYWQKHQFQQREEAVFFSPASTGAPSCDLDGYQLACNLVSAAKPWGIE